MAQSTQRATASSFLCLHPVQRTDEEWKESVFDSELNRRLLRIPSMDSELHLGHTNLFFSRQGLQKVWKQAKSLGSETDSLHCWQWSSDRSLSRSTESLTGGDEPLTDSGESAKGERER